MSRKQQKLHIEKKAWFLCKFLCRDLSEYNFEKVREHVSMCKGTKTRVKLSEKGWTLGTGLRLNSKLPKEFYPLAYIDNLCQDVMYVNVLLCILRLAETPDALDTQYEIVAFKFRDQVIVKKFQDVFQILVGAQSPLASSFPKASGSMASLSLVPSKAYHMGTLAPEKWGIPDRAGSTVGVSEVSYGSRAYNGGGGRSVAYSPSNVLPYGAIVPASAIQRRGYTASFSDRLASQGDDGDVVSFGSSDPGGFRDVAVMANLGSPGPASSAPLLHFQRYRSYPAQDGTARAEIGCQVDVNANGGARTNGWHQPMNGRTLLTSDGSVLSDTSSIIFEEANATYTNQNSVRRERIQSADIVDGSVSVRRVYSRNHSVGDALVGQNGHDQYPQESTNMLSRSRSVDPLQGRHPLQGSTYRLQTVSRQDLYSDNMSIRSQSSYLLDPRFKKTYAKRNPAMMSPQVYSGQPVYQDRFYRR
jgi:hypothetical protein